MPGRFITFEGTEGAGKSTQIKLLAERIQTSGRKIRLIREPGGTPIGEEIRHTLQHSSENAAMTPEAELLLINASRAQLVREVIRPALAAAEIVLCDRFYHSTLAYQGYGRQLDLARVQQIIDFAVGDTRPDLTLMLHVPLEISEQRRKTRPSPGTRDRFEESGRAFFQRVEQGFRALAQADRARIKWIEATQSIPTVAAEVWKHVHPLVV